MPRGRAISGSLMGRAKLEKSDKVRHNMPVVATVFIGKWALISTFDSQKGGAYRRDKNTYAGI